MNERQEKQMTAMGYAELAEQLTQSVHEIGQSLAEFRKEHGDDWLLIRDERGNPFAAPLLTAKANAIAALAILSKAGEAAT